MKMRISKTFKRFFALLLCLAMVLPLIPLQLPAKAAGTETNADATQWEAVSNQVRDIYLTVNQSADMSQTLEYDCGNGLSAGGEKSYMTIVEGAKASQFISFVAALDAQGYKPTYAPDSDAHYWTIASNTTTPNYFANFRTVDEKCRVYTYYLAAYEEIRIIVDSQADTVKGYTYAAQKGKTVEPKVVLWGLPQAPDGHNVGDALNAVNMVNYGAMTVILMPDNSLFIHDGGDVEQWSDEGCADFLKFCRELTETPEGEKMVINTWALSHAHHDHFRGFWRFLYKYHDQFDLKNVMYNIDRERSGEKYDITGAMKLVREVYPDVRYYKPHTGEKIDIAGVTLDILYTQEDRFVPDDQNNLAIDGDDLKGGTYREGLVDTTTLEAGFNDTSTVMKFTFNPGETNETDALLYADLNKATAIPMAVYPGGLLTADIVTVPHHGQNDQTALMALAQDGGAKVFFQYQHKGLAYGGDGDLTKQDMYGTFVTKVRNNFKKMFPDMVATPGSETANYRVFWAGIDTVTIDVNKLAATSNPRVEETEDGYYKTQDAQTYEYTGWDIMDDSDRLISLKKAYTNPEAKTMEYTPDFRLDLVHDDNEHTLGKLLSNHRYVIRKKGSDYIMSYTSVATTPGTPNRATSLKVVNLASETDQSAPNYYASDPGPVVYSPAGKTELYMNHSYRDQTLWILTQRNNEKGAYDQDVAKNTDVSTTTQAYKGLFGGTAYTHVYFWKGADNGNYWYAPQGQDGNNPATQYRYMYLKNWNTDDEDGSAAQSGRNWMTTSVAGLQESGSADLKRYVVENLGNGDFLIYWRNVAGTRVHFLACDEYGNWGEKIYTDESEFGNLDLYPNLPAKGSAELEALKVNLYHYNEFPTTGDKADPKNLSFTGSKYYNVEQGITAEQIAQIIQQNIKLWQTDKRRELPVPCSGWEPKIGYYYLDLHVGTRHITPEQLETSGDTYTQFDVDIRYVQDGKVSDGVQKTSLGTVHFYLYDRNLYLTGTKTYNVPAGTKQNDLRTLIANGITVKQSFSNSKGILAEYSEDEGDVLQDDTVLYSAIPEEGKYWLEFVPVTASGEAQQVNVYYRRTNGEDILVDTLSVNEVTVPKVDKGYVALNSGASATVVDAGGNPITFQVNGETLELNLGMLSTPGGLFVNTATEATHAGLTLEYRGQQVTGKDADQPFTFTLVVTKDSLAQENPGKGEPGHVGTNKQVSTPEADFTKDGVGNVQLSTYGVPFEKGVDIILVMDLSGSMKYGMDTNENAPNYEDSRMYKMQQSLRDLIEELQKSGTNVRIAMSDFGDLDHYEFDGAVVDTTIKKDQIFDANYGGSRYTNTYEFSNHLNYIFARNGSPLPNETSRQDKPFGQSVHVFNAASNRYTGGLDPHIYTGSGQVGVNAFVDVSTLYDGEDFTSDLGLIMKRLDENVQKGIGTNYDVGLEYAYHLGYAIRQDNIAKGEDREIVCIFMSDGAPMQYNYFTGHSESQAWAEWISGTVDETADAAGKNTAIQSITYKSDGSDVYGFAELKQDLLNLLIAGNLVRPEYQRDIVDKRLRDKDGKSKGSQIYEVANGYFIYRDRYKNAADTNATTTFFEIMDRQGLELDWNYLCRIAWANGIEDFDYEYYRNNLVMQELKDLLLNKTEIGYEEVNGDYVRVYRTKLKDPGLSEEQYFAKYKGESKDFFEAARALGIDDSFDYFTQIAYKNIDSLTNFKNAMGESDGEAALTEFVNQVYTKNFDGDSYWATLSPYAYFYNKDGKNWWAEAIKGDSDKIYPVINKYAESEDSPHDYNGEVINLYDINGDGKIDTTNTYDIDGDKQPDRYISGFQGLDIDIYGILFASAGEGETDSDDEADDSDVETATASVASEPQTMAAASTTENKGGTWDKLLYVPPIMQAISSNNGGEKGNFYFLASNEEELTQAFKSITDTMSEAATKAYFVDTIGKTFDLYYGQTESQKDAYVKVMRYNLDQNANRVGTPTVLETITFTTADGKLIGAYSDQVDAGNTNILLDNGLIQGRYVIYNTKTGENEYVDLYLDNTGRAFKLNPETFFWIIGDIGNQEIVLEYQVYLTGSMEGKVDTEGKKEYFNTNESATLYYTNYLGNTVAQGRESPKYPWKTVQDNSINVDKLVEKTDSADTFKLTLEAFGTGSSVLSPVSNEMVSLTGDTVLKEVISDYFDLADVQSVNVYMATFTGESASGSYEFGVKQPLSDVTVNFASSDGSARQDTILISGFNYQANFVGFQNNNQAHGSKLIVELEIKARDGFWGGNNVPTNEATTGIYMPDNSPVIYFPMPEANVPLKTPGITVKDAEIVYGEKVDPEDLVTGITVDGQNVTIGQDVGWMDDYAVLSWAPSMPTINNDIDGTYVYTVALAPKPEYSGAANLSENPSNLVGTRVERITASATAKVYVTYGLHDDTVVVDFGLPVEIDPLANDIASLPDAVTLTLDGIKSAANTDSVYSDTATSDHGTMEVIKDEKGVNVGHVRYTLTDMKLNAEDVFSYQAIVTIPEATEPEVTEPEATEPEVTEPDATEPAVYDASIVIIPATSIYYEDNSNLVTYHSGNGLAAWTQVTELGEGQTDLSSQDQDRPGVSSILSELDADNIYGYDTSYNTTASYSGGSAYMVNVTNKQSARASFTFTGTGFDIVSLCTKDTGMVMANVYRGEITDFSDSSNYHSDVYVMSLFVDTSYGYKKEGDKWVVDPDAKDTYYQVPVMKCDLTNVVWYAGDPENGIDPIVDNFGYGTYTVELVVGTTYDSTSPTYQNAQFYLDAIRVYNPAGYDGSYEYTEVLRDADGKPIIKKDDMGNDVYNEYGEPVYEMVVKSQNSSVIKDAYMDDGEGWPTYAELRTMFISQTKLADGDKLNGIVFIDGTGNEPTLKDYKSWGPNNEIYLNPGQSVAFNVDAQTYENNVAGIHMSMRALNGEGQVTVQSGTGTFNADGTVTLTDQKTILDDRQLSTTDMYYDISGKDADGNIAVLDKTVTVTNTGDTAVALTSLKVTHTDAPRVSDEINLEQLGGLISFSYQSAPIALEILTPDQLVDPIVTPKRPALSFNGMVCYNVFFTAEELGKLTEADLGLAVFDRYDPEGTVETAKDVIMGATLIDGQYMVATNGIHAKYLGDTQYFRVFAKKSDGTYVYSKMVSYSAVDYAKNALVKSGDVKLKQLVVAMLNYGAEAQKFFDYKVDDLMNKDLTADQQALLTGFDTTSLNAVGKVDASKVGAFASTGGFTRRSPAISFKGAFEINYFMTPANTVDGDMTLYFWNEDTYNAVGELTADNADRAVTMTLENGTYTAASVEIAAKYLDKTVYVAAVYESNGVRYCSGVLPYSIAAYCQKSPVSVQDLATAAAIYGCTAKQYFGV